jgi:glycosyltransferase involved in cell wall biosynthesis
MGDKKIFIQIASYRDPQLITTLRDCISNAKYPENLVFSIAWQHSVEDEWDSLFEYKNDKRFRVLDINYKDAKGACWARNQLQQNYKEEEYTLQLDSHHRFIKDWDDELINMYEQLRSNGINKPLLTSYISSFDPDNDPAGRINVPWKMNFDRFIPEGAVFFLPASIDNYKELTEPIPARFYSAHFAFASGQFVKEVPHDPDYYFHGEEISIAVRAYTHGYDLFHPHKIIAWHEYTRKNRTKQWDDDKSWHLKNDDCHLRNRKLFEMDGLSKDINFGIYDFGTERTLEDYERYAGLSFKKRAAQKYTIDNKLAPNPPLYGDEFDSSFLKIFKHCIDLYKPTFVEKDYDFWAVIFEDENNQQLHREDITSLDIVNLLETTDDFIKIWRTFNTEKKPNKWIVWPHSESKGWLEKIEGKL